MNEPTIRFDDGAAYERLMGVWSRLAGEVFLDWLAPPPALRWIDVGCGNGAFSELIVDRCAPSAVDGIDPSEGQLKFARTRPAARLATFHQGDAMALPYTDKSFDAATMALVIFFVPEPAKGVAEMVRVTRPGGLIASYTWDMFGYGFPMEPIQAEFRAMGLPSLMPSSAEASRMENLRALWAGGGIGEIETREITVARTYPGFDDFWSVAMASNIVRNGFAGMTPEEIEKLKSRVRARLVPDAVGRVTYSARANAIKGRLPG